MKKKYLAILCAGFMLWGLPAIADTLIDDGYGFVNPTNITSVFVGDGNDDDGDLDGLIWMVNTPEAWLEGLLGLQYDDPSVFEVVNEPDNKDNWQYAVISYTYLKDSCTTDRSFTHLEDSCITNGSPTWYAAFIDDGDHVLDYTSWSDTLNTGFNVTGTRYFADAAAPVPEPSTMLLLGTGMIGIAGVVRRKFKKS